MPACPRQQPARHPLLTAACQPAGEYHLASAAMPGLLPLKIVKAGVGLFEAQIAARHGNPRMTTRQTVRQNLHRHPEHIRAAYIVSGT